MSTAVIIITDLDNIEGGVNIKLRFDESLDKEVLQDYDSTAHKLALQLLAAIEDQYNATEQDDTDLAFNQPVHPTIQ